MNDLITDPKLISAMEELGRGLKSPSDLARLSREILKITVQASLNTEMDDHIGYTKHSPDGYNSGNSRNGYNRKTLKGLNCYCQVFTTDVLYNRYNYATDITYTHIHLNYFILF